MLKTLLKHSIAHADLGALFEFLAPNTLKVMPVRQVLKTAAALRRSLQEEKSWADSVERWNKQCQRTGLGFPISKQPESKRSKLTQNESEKVLEIFFSQILFQEVWILDLRSEAFSQPNHWSPLRYHLAPSRFFLEAVRGLYQGYYLKNNALFDRSLESLGLKNAKSTLLQHFGDAGDTRFELRKFQRTLTEVFKSAGKEPLHPEFLVLGLLLLALYQNLETQAHELQVRTVFERVLRQSA